MENEKCLCKEFRNERTPALRCLSDRWTHLCVGHDTDRHTVHAGPGSGGPEVVTV